MSVRLYTIIKAASTLALIAAAAPVAPATRDAGARFVEAREAFRSGERVHLARVAESLRDTEFAPWVDHWRLRLRIEEDSFAGVREFLERESGSYLAEKLRGEWLRQLGKRQDWKTFQQEYSSLAQPDQELVCYALQARLAKQQDATALDEARPLWFNAIDLPDACQPLMDRLLADKRLDAEDIWTRVRRLVEVRKFSAARTVAKQLPPEHTIDPRKLDVATDNPARYLAKQLPNFAATRPGRELALFAVVRLSRTDPDAAATRWRAIEEHYEAADRAYAWGQIAWQAAQNHEPAALAWYALTEGTRLSDEQHAWHARAALRVQDWSALTKAVERMPSRLAGQPEWIYWLGRAQLTRGHHDEARAQFLKIAGRPGFYGNLADDELGRPIAIPARAEPSTDEELAEAEANPGLRRALAVLRTDLGAEMRIEAIREWAWYLRGMDDRQLLAAAEFARRQGAIDRAIATAERTQFQHDYTLRYPAPFRAEVAAKAREASLDDAWVYGLMRQESRFVTEARSSVGARGLMQLMPATARWVAHKINFSGYHPSRVTEMDTNVTLGTSYLKMVLEVLDNQPVLASAAYNAGPNRAQKWRGSQALEGAIYAETIPFGETRDYVKKVMSNAVVYSALFEEKPQSLKTRLGVVRPAGAADDEVIELP
ncbi:MAG: lytic transglycosylase domain-containing protein [Rhodocyclales bacterium]|nr:lytic transglycosylase domain-containing protein [Rhodocyclales bacterium]